MSETSSEIEEKIRAILERLPSLYLSTAASDEPWVAGGFFAESDLFTLNMALELTGKTLSNIKANPRVAVVVSSGSPFEPFLQGAAVASVVSDGQEREAVKRALLTKAPQTEPFFEYPFEAVRLRVTSWRVTDVVNGWLPGKELKPQ